MRLRLLACVMVVALWSPCLRAEPETPPQVAARMATVKQWKQLLEVADRYRAQTILVQADAGDGHGQSMTLVRKGEWSSSRRLSADLDRLVAEFQDSPAATGRITVTLERDADAHASILGYQTRYQRWAHDGSWQLLQTRVGDSSQPDPTALATAPP